MHPVLLNQGLHHREGMRLRLVEREEQETCNEVHPLAVIQLLINDGIGLEYVIHVLLCDRLHTIKGAEDIDLDGIRYGLRQLHLRLLPVHIIFQLHAPRVNFEQTEPQVSPLSLEGMLGRSQQGLLEYLVGEELVEVTTYYEDSEEGLVRVQELDRHSHQHGSVS